MQFLAPLSLLLLGLALIVLAFHIRRRRNIAVPSLVIWRQLQAGQVRRNRSWQWPNWSWSLLLQMLAVLAMVGALAQPLLTRGPDIDHRIFVLDHSGQMGALNGGKTLLARVQAELGTHLANAAGAGRQSLLSVASRTEPVLVNQPIGAAGMEHALASVGLEDGPADWARLSDALRPLVAEGESTSVVIYSDRPVELPLLGENVAVQSVVLSGDSPNAAISASIVQDEDEAGKWTLTGVVRLDPGLASTEVVVGFATSAEGQPLEWSRRTIGDPKGQASDQVTEKSFSVSLDLPSAGIVNASLSDDGNSYDNDIRFVIEAAQPTFDILYIGGGGQPLLTALRAIEGTRIYQAPELPADLRQFGIVIVDNQTVARQPETNVLWVGNAGVGGVELAPGSKLSPTGAAEAHPLMRDVDWTGIEMDGSVLLPTDATTEVLLRSNAQPLITTKRTPYGRDVALAFDPGTSNWSEQSSLPVFTANLVQWLGLTPRSQLVPNCEVGALCRLDRRLEGGTISQVLPEGKTVALGTADWVPDRSGLYEVVQGDRQQLLAVDHVPAVSVSSSESEHIDNYPLPLWPFLLAFAALALVAEAIVSGRGAERFLVADGLRKNSPLSRRRRVTVVLHIVVLGLAAAAFFNMPMPFRKPGETLVQVSASGAPVAEGVDTLVEVEGSRVAAIARAAASVPWGEPGHLHVAGYTSGEDDELLALAEQLRRRDIVLDTAPFEANEDPIFVSALEAPEPVFTGDTFPLIGIVHAGASQSASLRFERDGEVLVEQRVGLSEGDNRVETIISDIPAGPADYRLIVNAENTGDPSNDTLSRVIEVGDAGEIAVIANDPARGEAFADWLRSQNISGTVLEPRRVPYRPRDWARYDGAVLIDVPAIALTTLQQEQIESAVAEQGMGLLILGGPNSFGPGGYLETPLENASPLSSRIPRDAPEATLVFVLDRSGSMQQSVGTGTRLDIAKQATLSAIDLLNQNSQVGIIVFDSEATTVLPLSRISDPVTVSSALTSVDPGGGTSVYPGLAAALDMLRDVDTPARHIIVMTDGLSQPGDFPGLLEDIRNEGITVSSVSIGSGAERGLIEEIARLGGGSFHATDDFAALPSILSQEAMLLSGSPIETGTTQPLWAGRSEPFLRGLPPTMPPIDGFVLTTAKPAATLSLVVPDSKGEPMPLLASWRFGAGQVLALTTEAVGPWSTQWQSLDSYAPLWAQVIRQFLPSVAKGDAVIELVRQGDGIVADLTLRNTALEAQPVLTVAGSDGEQVALPLSKRGTGSFRAIYYPQAPGAYQFTATAADASATQSIAMNYPAHRGATAPDLALRELAVLSGGAVDVANPTRRDLPDRWTTVAGWPFWLALALALFMIELTVRYTRLFAPRHPGGRPLPAASQTITRPSVVEPVHT